MRLCERLFALLILVAAGGLAPVRAHAQGGPAASAASQISVGQGALTASVGVLNPHLGGSPLWLWLDAQGEGEVRFLDEDGRVLWSSGTRRFGGRGELVLLPRPASLRLQVQATDGSGAPALRPLELTHSRIQQLSLPIIVVGGAESAQLATQLRARAPDRIIHHFLPEQLPTQPAAYLGASIVLLGPDAQLTDGAGTALRLFSCARGGVVALGPITLPPRPGCTEPPVLVGEEGLPSPQQLLQNIRPFQVHLGLLEERGPTTLFGQVITDTDAAGSLLARRPPWQAGVLTMLGTLVALFVVLHFSKKWRPRTAITAMALTPVAGGVLMMVMGAVMGRGGDTLALTTVDARTGAPVALAHTVQVSQKKQPPLQSRSPTAWVSIVEPTREAKKSGTAQPYVTHVVDVVDLAMPLQTLPDPADPSRSLVRPEGGKGEPAQRCGASDAAVTGTSVEAAHGRLLLEKCRILRGVVTPLQPGWVPALSERATDENQGAWVYLRASEKQP